MRDHISAYLLDRFLHQHFRLGVQCASGFVQQEDLRVTDERAGDRNPLLLAARKCDASSSDDRLVALNQCIFLVKSTVFVAKAGTAVNGRDSALNSEGTFFLLNTERESRHNAEFRILEWDKFTKKYSKSWDCLTVPDLSSTSLIFSTKYA